MCDQFNQSKTTSSQLNQADKEQRHGHGNRQFHSFQVGSSLFGEKNTAPQLPRENTGLLPGAIPRIRGSLTQLPAENVGYLSGNGHHAPEKNHKTNYHQDEKTLKNKTSLADALLLGQQRTSSSSSSSSLSNKKKSASKQSSLLGAPTLGNLSSCISQQTLTSTRDKLTSLKGAPSLKDGRGLW